MKAQNTNAFLVKINLSIQIGALAEMPIVTRSIKLNCEVCFRAEEINDSIADRMLPTKLQAGGFPITQVTHNFFSALVGFFRKFRA